MSQAASLKERPILFSGPMVQAILAGTKTQTRRVVKPQPQAWTCPDDYQVAECRGKEFWFTDKRFKGPMDFDPERNPYTEEKLRQRLNEATGPYGQAGDRLWVRESWWVVERAGQGIGNQFVIFDDEWDGQDVNESAPLRPCTHEERWGHRPSIFLRREYSRINLEVCSVRVERLQEISEEDAIAEGVQSTAEPVVYEDGHKDYTGFYAVEHYEELWNKINGKTAPWGNNPFVWVVEFQRL